MDLQGFINEINTRLDTVQNLLDSKIKEKEQFIELIKITPPHKIRKQFIGDKLDTLLDDIDKDHSDSAQKLNNLAIKVNEAIDVVSKNTEFSQNELKLAIDKSKEKIEKPQQKTKRRGGKYKRRKTIKSK